MVITSRRLRATFYLSVLLLVLGNADTSVRSQQGAPAEGITVHGHWVIEVRDPDGRLVSRREFENALASGGSNLLVGFLMRSNSLGLWEVRATSSNSPCPGSTCTLAESGSPFGESSSFFKSLVRGLVAGGNFGLRGNFNASRDGIIETVSTAVQRCGIGPSCSNTEPYIPFTAFKLNQPESVKLGQQVLITVEISFTSPTNSTPTA